MRPRLLIIMPRLSIAGATLYAAALAAYVSTDFDVLLVAGSLEADEMDGSYLLDGLPIHFAFL